MVDSGGDVGGGGGGKLGLQMVSPSANIRFAQTSDDDVIDKSRQRRNAADDEGSYGSPIRAPSR